MEGSRTATFPLLPRAGSWDAHWAIFARLLLYELAGWLWEGHVWTTAVEEARRAAAANQTAGQTQGSSCG